MGCIYSQQYKGLYAPKDEEYNEERRNADLAARGLKIPERPLHVHHSSLMQKQKGPQNFPWQWHHVENIRISEVDETREMEEDGLPLLSRSPLNARYLNNPSPIHRFVGIQNEILSDDSKLSSELSSQSMDLVFEHDLSQLYEDPLIGATMM